MFCVVPLFLLLLFAFHASGGPGNVASVLGPGTAAAFFFFFTVVVAVFLSVIFSFFFSFTVNLLVISNIVATADM